MNHKCTGDYFRTDSGGAFYRCLYDGTVLPVQRLPHDCPNCHREIAVVKHDALLPTRQFIATQVRIPGFGWCDMALEEIPDTEVRRGS